MTPLFTDIFGDFKFDRLVADGQKYKIEVKADGLPATKIDVTLDTSKDCGHPSSAINRAQRQHPGAKMVLRAGEAYCIEIMGWAGIGGGRSLGRTRLR